MPKIFKSREFTTGLLIFAFALFYRGLYLADYVQNPFISYVPPAFDQYNFDQGARNFAEGDWLARSPNNQYSPLYKYFLGSIYFFFGRNFPIVFFIQFAFGSFSALLVFLIGNRLFSYRIGLFSALAFSAYGPNLFYEGILLREFLVPFLSLLSIYALLCFKEHPSPRIAVACGIALSLLLQNRPNVLFVFPLLYFFFKDFSGPRTGHTKKVLFITCFLVSLPVLIQCAMVHKRFVFYDDSGPITLLTGNVVDFPGSEWTITSKIEKFQAEKEVTYLNVFKEIIGEMTSQPLDFLKLYGRKIVFLFHAHEFPSNLNFYIFRKFSGFLNTPWSTFSLFSSFGLVGMFLGLKSLHRLKLLYIFFAGISLSMLLVYVPGRFRLPLVPIIMLFAFYTLSYLAEKFKERNFRRFFSVLTLSLLLFFVFDRKLEGENIRDIDYVHLGEAYNEKGETDKALVSYQLAVKVNPYCQNAYQGILPILQTKGFKDKAIELLESGLKKASSMRYLSYNLAKLYIEKKLFREAEKIYRGILDREPDNAAVRNDFAVVLIRLNKKKEAVEEFQNALKIRPELEGAKRNLKNLLKDLAIQ